MKTITPLQKGSVVPQSPSESMDKPMVRPVKPPLTYEARIQKMNNKQLLGEIDRLDRKGETRDLIFTPILRALMLGHRAGKTPYPR